MQIYPVGLGCRCRIVSVFARPHDHQHVHNGNAKKTSNLNYADTLVITCEYLIESDMGFCSELKISKILKSKITADAWQNKH